MSIKDLNQTAARVAENGTIVASESGQGSDVNPTLPEDFGSLLNVFEEKSSSITEGEVVQGTVVSVTDQGVIIDIGYKCEGIVPREEFANPDGSLKVNVGDRVDVLIKSLENSEGYVVLSRSDAVRIQTWANIERAHAENKTIKGRVIERIKGGLRVDINGIQAFLPGSQVDVRPVRNLDSFKGKEIEAHVVKFNKKRSNIVLSRKSAIEQETTARKTETLAKLDEGYIVEGQIKNITEYGAFVDLGGIDGLLHVTDMSWGRVQNPAEVFKVGETVQVKVLKLDRNKERISLGYKQLTPDPWSVVPELFSKGQRVRGRVSNVTDYGAFVELGDNIEGLIHVTEMTWSKRIKHPSKIVSAGQEVEVVILDVDIANRRISLGLKQIEPNPWDTLTERYAVGQRVRGKVRNLTDFGAFVEIEDGIDGLVHVSDISHTKRIKHPSEALKKGQEIEAVITNIDSENRRLSLSIKDLEPSAWDKFFQDHKPGDVVRGRVVRFANFGVFVELAEGVEGLCHISELSKERVGKPESAVQLGQELNFKILKMDAAQKKIALSVRAVSSREDRDSVDVRSYTNNEEAMARLGEIAGFTGLSASSKESENK